MGLCWPFSTVWYFSWSLTSRRLVWKETFLELSASRSYLKAQHGMKSHVEWVDCCCCLVIKLCPILCGPHGLYPTRLLCGILQSRKLEWISTSFSRESSWPRDWTHASCISCTGRQILYHWAPKKAPGWKEVRSKQNTSKKTGHANI